LDLKKREKGQDEGKTGKRKKGEEVHNKRFNQVRPQINITCETIGITKSLYRLIKYRASLDGLLPLKTEDSEKNFKSQGEKLGRLK